VGVLSDTLVKDIGWLFRRIGFLASQVRKLEAELVAPAHDFNLKCSFIFNVLDTRGAIGVTERANYFGRMRRVARKIAEGYLDQRKRLEYPFIDNAQ